jgi:rhodanese-related sulfurtransferase
MFAFLMGLKSVSPAALHELMRAGSVTVVDVNSRRSWAEHHVPGAINLDSAAFADADLPQDKNASLIFYCSNPMCRKAPTAAKRAKQMGYANAMVMSAGITGWLGARLPIEAAPGA